MTEQEKEVKAMSALAIFASTQETFEEAKKKSKEESGNRVDYFRFKNDGTRDLRILPLAPVIDADGNVLPMDRKGYEYPLRTFMLKIAGATDKKGKQKITYVSVCNAKHAFQDRLQADLIDTYVSRACELNSDDEALCKKLRDNSYNGGLRWDYKRCMYAFDNDAPAEGIKILQLSYAQYKDLEERKLNTWAQLNKNGRNVPCPISSIESAYPVEITRKTENGKSSYSFNIGILKGPLSLNEEECQKLLDMPRLPEVLYRYTRFHLEATIAYLNQVDEKYGIEVMRDEEVQNCIEQIKCLLPADDQSHFTMDNKGSGNGSEEKSADITIDSLWDLYDHIENEGLGDKSEEGQELRANIKEYIENNDLDIRISHTKSNLDLLEAIEDIFKENGEKKEESAPKQKPAANVEVPEEENDDEPATLSNDEQETEEAPSRDRGYNADTNEPALRSERRSARPQRRR